MRSSNKIKAWREAHSARYDAQKYAVSMSGRVRLWDKELIDTAQQQRSCRPHLRSKLHAAAYPSYVIRIPCRLCMPTRRQVVVATHILLPMTDPCTSHLCACDPTMSQRELESVASPAAALPMFTTTRTRRAQMVLQATTPWT